MILIKGGRLVTHEAVSRSDVLIGDDGKISRVGRGISAPGAQTVDASGLHILPGAVDAHVHFRDPEDRRKEDFSTGSASALCGGVTSIMDMPNYRNPPTTTLAAYSDKRAIAASASRCDWMLRFGASEGNQAEAAASGAPSLKVFLTDTRSELSCSKAAAVGHFKAFPRNLPVCVHAEDRERIAERQGKFHEHEKIRDKLSSQMACEFALREAGRLERRVHLCHLTTGLEIELCRRYQNATYEVTPHHLFLSISDLKRLGQVDGVNPPLRDKREVAALWRNIGDDTILASDHAPHLMPQKLEGAPGFPGVGTMLPLVLNAARGKRVSLPQVARMCSFNPARAFGLASKGEISAGKDADIVLVDIKKKWKIAAENRLSKCGWTPYEGMEVFGKIEAVYLRGSLAYDGEGVLSKPGGGKELLYEPG
jgi:dihydroorotase